MKLLIVYGTTEGHTRKISQRIAARIREGGHEAALHDSTALAEDLDLEAFDGIIVAGSLHAHRHQASLAHFVKANLESLQAKPAAFLSVSLSAVREEDRQEAQDCADQFLEETGWRPMRTELVAGALIYTRYDFFKRFIMKLIAASSGGPTAIGRLSSPA